MKRVVNGEELEFSPSPEVDVFQLQDRLIVRGPDGAHSALGIKVGDESSVSYRGQVYTIEKAVRSRRSHQNQSSGEIRATMPGHIVDIFVQDGDRVKMGDKLVVLEAMKTQQAFAAPFEGIIAKVNVDKGRQVTEGQTLISLAKLPSEM